MLILEVLLKKNVYNPGDLAHKYSIVLCVTPLLSFYLNKIDKVLLVNSGKIFPKLETANHPYKDWKPIEI